MIRKNGDRKSMDACRVRTATVEIIGAGIFQQWTSSDWFDDDDETDIKT